MGSVAQPADITRTTTFLSPTASNYMTGQIVRLN